MLYIRLLIFVCIGLISFSASTENKTLGKQEKPARLKDGEVRHLDTLFKIEIGKSNIIHEVSGETDDGYPFNYEYPDDIQYANQKIFIVSSIERRVIYYDIANHKLCDFSKINSYLKSVKDDHNEWLEPIYIRVLKNYVVVGYAFKIIVFSPEGDFIRKFDFKHQIEELSTQNETLIIWTGSEIYSLDVANSSAMPVQIKDFKDTVDYSIYMINSGNSIFNGSQAALLSSSNNGLEINVGPVKTIDYVKFPQAKKENTSLNCVTGSYYVWYPWNLGNQYF